MPPPDKSPKPKPLSREQKLAQALRANLRRRKASERPADEMDEMDEAAKRGGDG